jgi:hypothetical protein
MKTMDKIKTPEELCEELCSYCPLEHKGTFATPNGDSCGCEGSHCKDAYEAYLDELESNPPMMPQDKPAEF